MRKSVLLTGLLIAAGFASTAFGQVLNPTISGDDMLCPEGTGTVTTQEFDSYQWYQRYYGSEDTMIIAGATSQTLVMDAYNYSASYLIVEVTEGGVTEMSPEFFVDGWAFAGLTVMTEGDFNTGPNGEAIICEGDSLTFSLMMPYDTTITWYNNGDTIVGENMPTLVVTDAGSYYVSGAPGVCPAFIQTLGTELVVLVDNCGLGLEEETLLHTTVYPNPATSVLTVENNVHPILALELHDQAGRQVRTIDVVANTATVDVSGLEQGSYFLTVRYANGSDVQRVVVR